MRNRFKRVFDKVSLDSAEKNSIIENVVNNQRVEREGRNFWQTNAGGIVMGCAALVVFVLINAALFGGINKGTATPMAPEGPGEESIKEYLLVTERSSEDVTITVAEETPESETSVVQEETGSEVETTSAEETAADSDMDVFDITKEEQEALFAQTAQRLPVKNAVMTAIMAVRDDNKYQHNGIDLTSDDTTVYAILDGTVTDYGYTAAKGNYLVIDNGNGVVTEYAHLSESLVSVGDVLSAGTPAAVMGNSGMSTGTHLHWEMTVNGELVNPLCYVAEHLK